MEKNIAVIWGDCSSPEIVKQTLRVLDQVAEKYGHTFHYTDAAMGGEAIDKYGDPLPRHELDKCLAADSVLLGAVGGPKWEGMPGDQRPEKGLLRLRAGMGLYSNLRPARIWPQLAPASPLKPEIVAQGIDFIIVRELIGGVYFGEHKTETLANGEKQAVDSMPYSEHEIERIGRIGFETAQKRNKKLCCVDKANAPIRFETAITTQANWKIIDDTHLLLTTGTEQMTVTIEASGKVAFTSETIEVNSPAYTRIGISLKEQSKDGYIRLTMRTKQL